MKKSLLLLIPCALLLSSCQEITIAFSLNDQHSAGLDNGSGSSREPVEYTYSYYPGDSIVDDAAGRPLVTANLTFKDIAESKTDIKEVDEIFSYFQNDQNILASVESPSYFSVRREGFAFLGAESSYAQGSITLNFSAPVYAIRVDARAYSYIKESFEDELIIDDEVGISANDKGFVKLSTTANEEKTAAISSICCFSFATPVEKVTLKAGKKRAILEKIAVYF